MDQTIQKRLTVLSETYKQRNFRLPKTEISEAAALLGRTLCEGADGAEVVVEFLRALPPDAIAMAIHDGWETLSQESKTQLLDGILDLPRTDRFDRLKLIVAARVVHLDPIQGATFLSRACTSLDSRTGGHSGTEVVQLFRRTFLDDIDWRLEKLVILVHPSAVTASLLGFVIQSLSIPAGGSPDIPLPLQLKVVKWIFRNQAYPQLKATHQTQLSEAIKRWPPPAQVELCSFLESLPPGFEFLLDHSQRANCEAQPQPALTARSPSSTPVAEAVPASRHWKEILGELTKQIADLDERNTVTKDLLAGGRQKIAKLEDAARLADARIKNLEEESGKKAMELGQVVGELSAARIALVKTVKQIEALESQVSELRQKHQEQVALLVSRIDTEAAYRVDSFKHTLARVLRVDYAEFRMNEAKPMTTELGQGLRHLLASIFDHLQRNGINTKD